MVTEQLESLQEFKDSLLAAALTDYVAATNYEYKTSIEAQRVEDFKNGVSGTGKNRAVILAHGEYKSQQIVLQNGELYLRKLGK